MVDETLTYLTSQMSDRATICVLFIAIWSLLVTVDTVENTDYYQDVRKNISTPVILEYVNKKPLGITCGECITNCNWSMDGLPVEERVQKLTHWGYIDARGNELVLMPESDVSTQWRGFVMCRNATHIIKLYYVRPIGTTWTGTCAGMNMAQHPVLNCDVSQTSRCTWTLNKTLRIAQDYTGPILIPGLQIPAANGTFSCDCVAFKDGDEIQSFQRNFNVTFGNINNQGVCGFILQEETKWLTSSTTTTTTTTTTPTTTTLPITVTKRTTTFTTKTQSGRDENPRNDRQQQTASSWTLKKTLILLVLVAAVILALVLGILLGKKYKNRCRNAGGEQGNRQTEYPLVDIQTEQAQGDQAIPGTGPLFENT